MEYTAVGVNHLTWFIKVRIKGKDALPALQRIAARELLLLNNLNSKDVGLGKAFLEAGNLPKNPVHDINPFTWQLMQLFNAFPAVLDRHVTEFFPHIFARKKSYYGRTLGVDAYSFENCIAYGDKIYNQMREDASSQKPLSADYFKKISGEQEQVLGIIRSIRHDTGEIYSANLPNKGQVPNLPEGAIVESPAVAGKGGLKPIKQEPLPFGLVGTLASRFPWVETIVEAALTGSENKFVQALLLDGAVDSPETAAKLAGDLLAAQAKFLPQFSPKSKNNLHRESKK
jgi:alpha-galactosidase